MGHSTLVVESEGGTVRVLEDRSEMLPPGICFVCETAPQGRVVDTLQEFVPGFPSHLSGRKFVCSGCIEAACRALGFVSAEESFRAVADAELARVRQGAMIGEARAVAEELVSRLEEAALRAHPDPVAPVAEERPDLVEAQEVAADPEAVEPNAVERPSAQVSRPRRKADVQDA